MTTVYARSDFESDLTATKVQSDRTMSPSMIRSLGLLVLVCFISRKCVKARGCQIAKVQPGLLCGLLACDWWGVQSTSIHPSVDFGLFKLSNIFAQPQSNPEWEDWTTFFLNFIYCSEQVANRADPLSYMDLFQLGVFCELICDILPFHGTSISLIDKDIKSGWFCTSWQFRRACNNLIRVMWLRRLAPEPACRAATSTSSTAASSSTEETWPPPPLLAADGLTSTHPSVPASRLLVHPDYCFSSESWQRVFIGAGGRCETFI